MIGYTCAEGMAANVLQVKVHGEMSPCFPLKTLKLNYGPGLTGGAHAAALSLRVAKVGKPPHTSMERLKGKSSVKKHSNPGKLR